MSTLQELEIFHLSGGDLVAVFLNIKKYVKISYLKELPVEVLNRMKIGIDKGEKYKKLIKN